MYLLRKVKRVRLIIKEKKEKEKGKNKKSKGHLLRNKIR